MGIITTCTTLLCLVVALHLVGGVPAKDYQYDETYSYEYDEDSNYDEDIPKPKEKVNSDIPIIETESKNIEVDLGTTIRLPCHVDNLPGNIPIIWSRIDNDNAVIAVGDNIPIESYKQRTSVEASSKGSILTIGAATVEDAGQYKCSVAVPGKNRPEVKHSVSIRAPPSIHSSSKSLLEAERGQDVKMYCHGTGSPKPTVKWTRVGKGSLPDGKAELEAEELLLTSVTRHHAGVYRCTASNGFGSGTSKDIELRVLFKPEIEVEEVFIHTKAGNEVELVCTVHAVPHATVTWKKDGQPIGLTDRIKMDSHHSRHSLTIKSVRSDDYGRYSCHATSTKGSADKTIQISGHARSADFKSRPEGEAENSYLIEWTSLSYTPLTEFRLEVRREGEQWTHHTLAANEEGNYHYAGKMFLKELEPASRFEARVSSLNDEGWSSPSTVFHFATRGAEPRQEEMTAGSAGLTCTFICLLLSLLLALRN